MSGTKCGNNMHKEEFAWNCKMQNGKLKFDKGFVILYWLNSSAVIQENFAY